MKKIVLSIFILLICIYFANAQKISPFVFGQNHWIENGDEGDRPGYIHLLWPKIKDSGIKMVRIGGNGYNNRNHRFFDADRKALNSLLDSIRGIGAEPLFQIAVGKDEAHDMSVEQAVELVKYYKYSNGKGIRYYCLGNEPLLHDREGIQKVYNFIIKYAPAMKKADPTIKIFVFDECSLFEIPHKRILGGDLDVTGKDENGNWMVDGITFHRYPDSKTRERVIFEGSNDIRKQVRQLMGMIDFANTKNGRTGDAKLLWGLTEFNVSGGITDREISGVGNASFLGGQFIAEIYGIGLQYGAFTMAPWCISETDHLATDFGYIGLPMDFLPRSSYYHTQMMACNMKGEFLPTTSTNSFVHTIASKSDEEICVMILNRDKYNDFEFDLILNKDADSSKPLIVRADIGLNTIIKDRIPNQTTMMFVLSKTGEILRKYSYGLEHNLKYLPPEVK
jgi:hypothetical protein